MKPITLLVRRRFSAVYQIAELLRKTLAHCFSHLIWLVVLVPFQSRATMPDIVPKPVSVVNGSGMFLLGADTAIDADTESQQTARRLKQALAPATGFEFAAAAGGNTIEIRKDPSLVNLGSKGRKLIGWDDVMGGNLSHTAGVMVWHSFQFAEPALKNGNSIVLTPLEHLFLDLYQTDIKFVPQPVAAEGLNSLETVYAFSPIPPGATPEQIKLVLGIQGNVWTENVEDWLKVQYQLLPRACAIAEIGWTPQEARDFGDFERRLGY